MEIKVTNLWLFDSASEIRAIVSVTLDGSFAVNSIKVIEGRGHQLSVAMPSKLNKRGEYRDLIHPITSAARKQLEEVILGAYKIKTSGGKQNE